MPNPNRVSGDKPALRVHATHRPPAPVLRFIDQVVDPNDDTVDFRYSQGVLTDFDVDVVHVLEEHLDTLLGTRGAGAVQRLLATWAFTRNLRKHNIALVRTLQEVAAPKQYGRAGKQAQKMLDAATDAFVTFDETVPSPDPSRTRVIPHALFHERFVGYPGGEQVHGRVLCLARGRLSRPVLGLLGYTEVSTVPGVSLRFAGEPRGVVKERTEAEAARRNGAVSTRIEVLSDTARVQEIDEAELIVLPRAPRSMHDLQVVYLALTRGRPVLTVRTPSLQRLADEVGEGWLHLVDGKIVAERIDAALLASREASDRTLAQSQARLQSSTTAAYRALFEDIIAAKRSYSSASIA